ncbi:hypothetical protein BDZ89DRAFT_400901 [Hymenopellis radicata]|nr:hypothetical protein BDZ89DRAFT_400901 [Hymenopellis radicata]
MITDYLRTLFSSRFRLALSGCASVAITIAKKGHSEFNSADADVVLASCDGARFAVHKCILSLASPFFKDMFSLPQPSSGSSVPKDVDIECTESKAVLCALLHFMYPVPNPQIASLDELVPLIEAAQKFRLEYLHDELRAMLIDERFGFVKKAPLRVYAIATRFPKGHASGGERPAAVQCSRLRDHDSGVTRVEI